MSDVQDVATLEFIELLAFQKFCKDRDIVRSELTILSFLLTEESNIICKGPCAFDLAGSVGLFDPRPKIQLSAIEVGLTIPVFLSDISVHYGVSGSFDGEDINLKVWYAELFKPDEIIEGNRAIIPIAAGKSSTVTRSKSYKFPPPSVLAAEHVACIVNKTLEVFVVRFAE